MPVLPTLRRIYSPSYLMPLALIGFRRTKERMFAAHWPTACLVDSLDDHAVRVWNLERDAAGGSTSTGWEYPRPNTSFWPCWQLYPIANADDLQILLETFGNAFYHIREKRTRKTVQRPRFLLIAVRVRTSCSPSCVIVILSLNFDCSSPFLPFTVTMPPSCVTVTPEGKSMGSFLFST